MGALYYGIFRKEVKNKKTDEHCSEEEPVNDVLICKEKGESAHKELKTF